MRFVGPVRFIFKGDLDRARSHLGEARKLIGTMDAINPSRYASLPERLPDGTFMKAINNAGQRMVIIDAPESPVVQPSVRNYYLARVTGGETNRANLWVSQAPNWNVNLTADITDLGDFDYLNGAVCTFSPDGEYLVVGGWEHSGGGPVTYIFEVGTWTLLHTIQEGFGSGSASQQNEASFSPDGQYLAIAGGSSGVYEVGTWQKIANPWSGESGFILGAQWGYDFNFSKYYLVTCWFSNSPWIISYNVPEWTEAWRESQAFGGYQTENLAVRSPAEGVGDTIVAAPRKSVNTPFIRNMTPGLGIGFPTSLPAGPDRVLDIGIPPDRAYLAALAIENFGGSSVAIWDSTFEDVANFVDWPILSDPRLVDSAGYPFLTAEWSPDSRYVALATAAPTGTDPSIGLGNIILLDVENQTVEIGPPMGAEPWVTGSQIAAFSPFITS